MSRIGIHSGDVTFKDEDLFGDGVNIASRIQGEAAPGGICISEPVYKTIRNNAGIKAEFVGNRRLKNVLGKTKLYQISAQGIETKGHTPVKVISQLRSLLSIARLNKARFLTRPVISRLIRTAYISFNFKGNF